MNWKHIMSLFLLMTLLSACKGLGLPGQIRSAPAATPSASPSVVSPTLKLEWNDKLPMDLRVEQAVVVRDVVYFSNFGLTAEGAQGATPTIAAFNLSTRKLLWQVEQKPLIPIDSDGERLFALMDRGIAAISIKDGSTLWQTSVTPEYNDSYYDKLLARDGWVFYSHNYSDTNTLYALNAQTGAIVWTTPLAAPIDWLEPNEGRSFWNEFRAIDYDRGIFYARVVIDLSGKEKFRFALIALDAKDGHKLWDFPFETPVTRGDGPPGAASRLAFSEQAVYFGAFGGTSYALRRDTGQVLWKRTMDMVRPVYIDDQIIAVSGYGKVANVDARTGDLKWAIPYMDRGLGMLSPFVIHNGYLVFYVSDSQGGQLSVVAIKSGKKVSTLPMNSPHDCGEFPPVFTLYGEHLYLMTLKCVYSFQMFQ